MPQHPAIILVSETRAGFLRDEFSRDTRDYELVDATTAAEAEALARRARALVESTFDVRRQARELDEIARARSLQEVA